MSSGAQAGRTCRPVRSRRALAGAFLVVGLAACAVGPDFHRPELPDGGYVDADLRKVFKGPPPLGGADGALPSVDQQVGENALVEDWWTLFHCAALDRLVQEGLRNNPGLDQASAALRQAQEVLTAAVGNLRWPSVNASLAAERERASAAAIGIPTGGNAFNLYNAQVSVSYTFDIFGSVRRQIEATKAQVDNQEQLLRAARLALASNIATAAIREAQYEAQLAAWRRVEALQRDALKMAERRFALGAIAEGELATRGSNLAATRTNLPGLEKRRDLNRHLLAIYLGKPPGALQLEPIRLADFTLPAELPAVVPSELAHRRPDILAAEALVHAASAQIGVATANLYPQVTLSGGFGFEGLSVGQWFTPSAATWALGGGLVQPLFHGGALSAQRRAAIDAYDQAAAAYRQTVLTAFGNVADALKALDKDAAALDTDAQVRSAAHRSFELNRAQRDAGAASEIDALDIEVPVRRSEVDIAQGDADRLADTVALFQAIGGGWWNARDALPAAEQAAPPAR